MARPIGSGSKQRYVSFRTSSTRFETMLRVGRAKGLRTKSKVYRAAEELFITSNKELVESTKHGIKASKKEGSLKGGSR